MSGTANADRAAELLRQVVPRVRRFLVLGLQEQELTLQQLGVLSCVAGGPRSSGAIAAELAIRLPTLTDLVTPLCQRGLLTRRRDPENRRCVVLELTPAGETAWAQVNEVAHTRAKRLIATLSAAQRRSIIGALMSLERALAVHDDSGRVAASSLPTALTGRFE